MATDHTTFPPSHRGERAGWAALLDWQVDRGDGAPLFRQIYLEMRAAILTQRLKPGAKLPSTRSLATSLRVARASVVAAYEQLLAEGYVAGKVGAGTYVSADLPESPERGKTRRPKSSARLVPKPVRQFPYFAAATAEGEDCPFQGGRALVDARTVDAWRKLTQRAWRSFGPVHLGYSDARGVVELRRAIGDYLLATRGVRADPEQIVITAGTQHAIDLAMRVLLAPGDEVWVEDPGYPLTQAALTAGGLRLCPIPVDAQGMSVAAGIRAAPKARAAFVTPSHQFPLGVVMSMARRLELIAWAREVGAFILEDDYHSEFRYAGRTLAALQGLDDGEQVLYVGTLNKALFPGLRVGYVVVPRSLLPAFVGARFLVDRQPPTLLQGALAEFLSEGHFAAHIRRMRLLYREQRDALVSTLQRRAGDAVEVTPPDQGMHLVAYLGDGIADTALEERARAAGLIARAISPLFRRAPPRSGLLLGFTGHPRPLILPAAARLARLIAQAADSKRGSVRKR
jgi:GntR family transcriptional regulator/MocR family aminotransferase